jgi:hypothetical protein
LKLLNLKQIDFICRRFDDFNSKLTKLSPVDVNLNKCYYNTTIFNDIQNECLNRLAQVLDICWRFNFITCDKVEIKKMFNNYIDSDNYSLLKSVLN